MKILWLSKHKPLPREIGELQRLFGEGTTVHTDMDPFTTADSIVEQFKQGGYGEIVAVAPLSVLQKLVDRGVRPIWAEMQEVGDRRMADLEYRGRLLRFVKFKRVTGLTLEFEEIQPQGGR